MINKKTQNAKVSISNWQYYIILDTNVILRNWSLILNESLPGTTKLKPFFIAPSSVIKELKKDISSTIRKIVEDKITVIDPSQKSLIYAKDIARKLGIDVDLSRADLDIIALGLDFINKQNFVYIWTDDLKIQNVSRFLGIPTISLRKKIRYLIYRAKKCLDCGWIYPYGLESCPLCGSYSFKIVIKKVRLSRDDE